MSEKTKPYGSLMLPSKGLLYDGFLEDGMIEVFDWGTDIEELFAGSTASTNNLIDSILKRTIKTEGVNPSDLLSGDRLYVFFMSRSKAYGSNYGFPFKCSNCGIQYRYSIEINDLEVKELPEGASEPFEVELPNGDKIGFRLLRGKDEAEIEKYEAKVFKKAAPQGDPTYKYRWAKHIVSINGTEPKNNKEKMNYISGMTARDSHFFRKAVDEIEPKFDFIIDTECKKCGMADEMILPFSKEFLDPK